MARPIDERIKAKEDALKAVKAKIEKLKAEASKLEADIVTLNAKKKEEIIGSMSDEDLMAAIEQYKAKNQK